MRLEIFTAGPHVFHLFWAVLPEAAEAMGRAGRFCAGGHDARSREARAGTGP